MKKNYNPFKMWGSWAGTIVGLIFFVYPLDINGNPLLPNYIANNTGLKLLGLLFPIGSFILFLIGGFLVGYGIHSLIRRLR